MFFLAIARNCLSICIFVSTMVVFHPGISKAEEHIESALDKTSGEATTAPLPKTHEEAHEVVQLPASGSYYKIDAQSYAYYEKPKAYSFLVNTPLNIIDWLKESFQSKNALTIVGLAAVTGGLIAVDQDLDRMAQNVGHSLNISTDSKMGRAWPGSPIQYPTDFGSALYYLGDGMIPISIATGMLGYGLFTSDVRSLQTSSQLAEGLLSVAIVVQTIKRTAGRESPGEKTQSGGTWRPFPGFKEYGRNTPKYDAFPSGHLATTMMTITVLADNYPEYTLIKPIGFTLMGLLGFQMMNNGVHWASDYPIAIAIGYGLGKVAVSHGRKVVSSADIPEQASKNSLFTEMSVLPMPIKNGGALFMVAKF